MHVASLARVDIGKRPDIVRNPRAVADKIRKIEDNCRQKCTHLAQTVFTKRRGLRDAIRAPKTGPRPYTWSSREAASRALDKWCAHCVTIRVKCRKNSPWGPPRRRAQCSRAEYHWAADHVRVFTDALRGSAVDPTAAGPVNGHGTRIQPSRTTSMITDKQ